MAHALLIQRLFGAFVRDPVLTGVCGIKKDSQQLSGELNARFLLINKGVNPHLPRYSE